MLPRICFAKAICNVKQHNTTLLFIPKLKTFRPNMQYIIAIVGWLCKLILLSPLSLTVRAEHTKRITMQLVKIKQLSILQIFRNLKYKKSKASYHLNDALLFCTYQTISCAVERTYCGFVRSNSNPAEKSALFQRR